jgi:malate synthase
VRPPLEPSEAVVKRMAQINPEGLVNEVLKLRRERDALRTSLQVKVGEFFKNVALQPDDLLLVRKLTRMSPELMQEVAQMISEKLQARYDWRGLLLVQESLSIEKLPDDVAKDLYERLQERFEG